MAEPVHSLAVGELYIPGKTHWPEGAEYNYRAGGHELRLFFNQPAPEEVEGVRVGESEFALLTEQGAIFLLYRFGEAVEDATRDALPWSDAPYNWWLNAPEDRSIPDAPGSTEERALLMITLVNAGTGIVLALRAVSLSPAFTDALHQAIRRQSRTAWTGRAEYDKTIERLYRRYPDTPSMLAAAKVTCKGGA